MGGQDKSHRSAVAAAGEPIPKINNSDAPLTPRQAAVHVAMSAAYHRLWLQRYTVAVR